MPTESDRGVLRVKSFAPTLRQRVYVPPRLRERVSRSLVNGVTLVQAPAGYGKTSVVLQTLLDQGIEPHWYTCTPEDQEPALLLAGVVWALGRAEFRGGAATLASLARSDARRSFAGALQPLLNEMAESLPDPSVLVIDDADHAVSSAPAALDYLLRHAPARLHVLILSRGQISMPWLVRALAQGTAETIEGDAMLLRRDEVGPCLAQAYGRAVDDEEAGRLYAMTSGWGVAIRLTCRLREMEPDLPWERIQAALSQQPGTLFDYLASEVLQRLDPETDAFLRATAVLETLDPEICTAMTGVERAAELIQGLVRSGLPVLKVGWNTYRGHSLLREHILASLTPEERRELDRSAGAAYGAASRWVEALRHYAAASDSSSALDIVDAHGGELFRMGYGATLVKTVREAPAEIVEAHHTARRWAAFAAFRMAEWDWALDALQRSEAGARLRGDQAGVQAALEGLARMCNVRGRFDAARDAGMQLFEAIDAGQRASRAAAILAHVVPATTGIGRFQEAMRLISEHLPQLDAPPAASPEMEVQARAVTAIAFARAGDFAAARVQLAAAAALQSRCTDETARSLASWLGGITAFLAGDFAAARAAADEAETIAVPVGDLDRQGECHALRGAIHTCLGDVGAAEAEFAQATGLTPGAPPFWVLLLSLLARPRLFNLRGDPAAAAAAADANLKLAESTKETWFACLAHLEVALDRLMRNEPEAALEHIERAIALNDELDSDLLRCGALLMRAAALSEGGDMSLAEALAVAERRDYRCLAFGWARAEPVASALRRGLRTDLRERAALLLRTAREAPAAPGQGAARYGLSEREREVLTLIARGVRTREIAAQLVITASTVSTHIEHIMAKTGTASRAELVSLAVREQLA